MLPRGTQRCLCLAIDSSRIFLVPPTKNASAAIGCCPTQPFAQSSHKGTQHENRTDSDQSTTTNDFPATGHNSSLRPQVPAAAERGLWRRRPRRLPGRTGRTTGGGGIEAEEKPTRGIAADAVSSGGLPLLLGTAKFGSTQLSVARGRVIVLHDLRSTPTADGCSFRSPPPCLMRRDAKRPR